MRLLRALFLTAFVLTTTQTAGCAGLVSLLPKVVSIATDAAMILDGIQAFVSSYFVAAPNPELQAKVDDAITDCRVSLQIALRTADGAESLSRSEVDEAFDAFKAAYLELMQLVGPLGVKQALPGVDTMQVSPQSLTVPQPLAFGLE